MSEIVTDWTLRLAEIRRRHRYRAESLGLADLHRDIAAALAAARKAGAQEERERLAKAAEVIDFDNMESANDLAQWVEDQAGEG